MPWFEAKERIQLADSRVVNEGDRFQYPYRAGLARVEANRVDWSSSPSEGTEVSAESSVDPGSRPLESVDWTDIDGIGPSTAEAIEAAIEATFLDVETVDALLDEKLTELGGVGPSTAEDLRSYLEEL